ncbi:MAG: hypothetical protein A2509_11790 [Candidatus Edwardsbacteria bacterium RIFOXYD12_FULL_50_11]|uniref:Uncharacterized protein n=1 Tax=Candidatus Edwardsbacteria bacterium GWF2_54_11 TaxID=1817851 RepID=A0A1F5QY74_9BACT|nr:MAG: hypothetical protein A2502_04260 [Candidatus Edwardsbacteria bacterium RifOxyC12_full_54_24]OGF07165.1 MAG: hypothetical protein A2024_09605 [Candidatus Edwardsbacteria bacterium GWF2_54_11]OGF08611.1 MAG: hypothetical protein A2273_06640 [Candidatus Edwardsbacteria bacterium RifOxyA12_full_54_48]OGF11255.1 MAG: hypothetical protein A3K15_02705 [Candidatus Edwardsbacteria bacterium GWE2_54_12]OGF16803.1 MAG: hypothetical protein A2509_11790 [Candidatus Edwardsbacteria bacterium RIFOXYD1
MSTTEIAVFISAIATLISAAAVIVSAITARATIKYAKTTEEMAKDEKRKYNYNIFNDKFKSINNNYLTITVIGPKEKEYNGSHALRLLIPENNLRGLQNNLVKERGLKQFRYVIQTMDLLIKDLNKLHKEDKASIKENVIKFYENSIKEFIEILLTYKEHINGLIPEQRILVTECYDFYEIMSKLENSIDGG